MSIFDSIIKTAGNELAQTADKGTTGDVHDYIDTGSYSLNALITGSIYKGYPEGKVTCIASDPATGKTFALLTACKNFLDRNKTAAVFYYESESAITKDDLEDRGIDTKRFYILPVSTIQEFRTQALKVLDAYAKVPIKERPKMLMCLDSLGMLSTTKEQEDSLAGSETKDMTKSQVIKAAFRTVTLSLGKANVAMIITMHTYACLTAGNKVKAEFGSIDIKDLKTGDKVQTTEGIQEISFTCKYDDVKTIKIEMEDGNSIECTLNHKFIDSITGKWVMAIDLIEGQDIATM